MSHHINCFLICHKYLKLPRSRRLSSYINLTLSQIAELHNDYTIISSDSPDLSYLEIRLSGATLTCELRGGVCTDARLFADNDSADISDRDDNISEPMIIKH